MTLEERLAAIRAAHAPDGRLAVLEVAVVEGRLTGRTTAAAALAELAALAEGAGLAHAVEALPNASVGAAARAVAHRSLAHLRAEPRHGSELVSQLVLGEEARVLQDAGDWLRVQVADGYVAWVHARSVVCGPGDPGFDARLAAGGRPEGSWVVTGRAAVARETGGAPVADLVQGGVVEAVEIAEGAVRVRLPDGVEGWVGALDVAPAERLAEVFPAAGRAALDHAAEFLGLPYLWGGTSEKGFDCSGLVQRILALHGARVPRDSDLQAAAGAPVDPGAAFENAVDGDLAFFSENPGAPGRAGRATHVGFLARGGRVVHASTTRNGVQWDALAPGDPARTEYGDRLASMLIGVRRVLPET